MAEEDDAKLRWKVDKDLELYRFYLDVGVKAFGLLMAVTGGIASYVLTRPSGTIVTIALAFPAMVNAGFSILFLYSAREAARMQQLHVSTCIKLGVAEFNMKPLRSICQIFGLMCAIATFGLLVLMLRNA